MKFVFLGPPGAGKGTQAELLSDKYAVAHISTGDLLRKAIKEHAPLGIKAKRFMEQGELVPDDIVVALIKDALGTREARKGFILDGFPRNVAQAEVLDRELENAGAALEAVLYFKTSEPVVIKRLTGRRVCGVCGKNYHLKNMPPKQAGVCDECKGTLLQRPDDKEDVIKKRLSVYEASTKGLVDYYEKRNMLTVVNGDEEVRELFPELCAIFERYP